MEAHVNHCPPCREELERLQLTEAALFSLRDEEIPQRIAFRQRPDFRAFARAALAQRLLGIHRAPGVRLRRHALRVDFLFCCHPSGSAPDRTAVTPVAAVSPSPQEVQQQIQQAVAQAVAAVEARQTAKNKELVAYFERQSDETLRSVRWMAGELDANRKRAQVTRVLARGAARRKCPAVRKRGRQMKPGFAILLLSLAPAWCQVKPAAVIASSNLPASKAARIPLDAMKDLERTFNYRLASLADVNEPMELMGDFRAVQLDDYGVVVTSEVSLVVTPASCRAGRRFRRNWRREFTSSVWNACRFSRRA